MAGRASSFRPFSSPRVYALGVVCFELLAGHPYDFKEMTPDRLLTVITEEGPPKLGSINPCLRGDVETIIGKALEKEKPRRYQSVAAFADDIRRFLNDEPIMARPAGAFRRIRKFTKRNKMFVGAAALALAFLFGGTAWVTGLSVRLRMQRQHMAASRDAARDSSQLMKFAIWHENGPDGPMPDRSVVDRILKQIEVWDQQARRTGRAAISPPIEHQWKDMLGFAYYQLKLYDVAEPLLRRSLEVSREFYGRRDQWTLRSTNVLFDSLRDQGKLAEAETLLQRAFDDCDYRPGDEHDHTDTQEGCMRAMRLLRLCQNLAQLRHKQGRLREAELIFRATLESLLRVLEAYAKIQPELFVELPSLAEHDNILELKTDLGQLLMDLERPKEAEELFREVLGAQFRRKEPVGSATRRAKEYLGVAFLSQG